MISFTKLGHYGRFGNQLFQYAFLRTTAQRLGVKFFCPEWLGDRVFLLDDEDERSRLPQSTENVYRQPRENVGFIVSALHIEDDTEIVGYFQAERYFDRAAVTRWYTFRPEIVGAVQRKYQHLDLAQCTGIHLRFGDKKGDPLFVILPPRYYAQALTMVPHRRHVLVFSDEMVAAKEHLRHVSGDFLYIEGNEDLEDLYLMSRCRDFVCSVSTFSWWGAWLNEHPDKIVIAPPEGTRPGSAVGSPDFCCPGWIPLDTMRFIVDDYRFVVWQRLWQLWQGRLRRVPERDLRGNLTSLKRFVRHTLGI
jgi:hypothetical protein